MAIQWIVPTSGRINKNDVVVTKCKAGNGDRKIIRLAIRMDFAKGKLKSNRVIFPFDENRLYIMESEKGFKAQPDPNKTRLLVKSKNPDSVSDDVIGSYKLTSQAQNGTLVFEKVK